MALNPNIALQAGQGVPQLDLMGAAQKGLSLVDLMQQVQMRPELQRQQLSTAQTAEAGAKLLNEQTARELAARKRLAEIARVNSKVEPKTGKISLDHNTIASIAASEGMDPGTVFNYMQRGAETAQGNIKTAADASKYANEVLSTANNLLRVQDNPMRAADIAAKTKSVLSNVLGEDDAKKYISQFWSLPESPPTDPATGQPSVAMAGQQFIDQARINAKATISPQQAIANAQTEESLRQAGAAGITSPEARNPTSTVSRQAQDDYLAANPTANRARIMRLSAADIQHLSGTGGLIRENIVPGATKAEAISTGIKYENQAKILDSLADAASRVPPTFNTPISNILQGVYNKAWDADPAFNEYRTRLLEAQQAGIPLTQGMGTPSVSQYAKSKAAELRAQGKEAKSMVAPTFTTTPEGVIKRQEAVADAEEQLRKFAAEQKAKGTAEKPKAAAASSSSDEIVWQGKTYKYKGTGARNNFRNWEVK